MTKEIKYIGFYDLPDSKSKRVSNLAATSKMEYITDALIEAGYKVHLISPSWLSDKANNSGFQAKKIIQINENKRITFCPSFGTRKKWTRNLKIIFTLGWLFLWLLKNTMKNEKVLVYHVQWLSLPIRWAKKIKGFKLVLEVEEIYGDISVIHPYFNVLEEKLITAADAYIFSTELLAEKINTSKKPQVFVYGVYKTYPRLASPLEDEKIHLVYAGIIDTQKGGAFNAIECTSFLPANYILHIIGFGDTDKLEKRIDELNKTNKCKIIFDGTKRENEYIKYVQKCHIGLNTQNTKGKYIESSFPSKILSYLSLGLEVLSCDIKCVRESKVSHLVHFYKEDTPLSIAQAILRIKSKPNKATNSLNSLDKEFINYLRTNII